VLRFGSQVVIDGIEIARDDMIVADDDGVVVVPLDVADEVVRLAVDKDRHEADFRRAVRNGMSPRVAFETFGVL
jgi:4-hydroxy-4-methyl-2-oxoglutarate aldolase